MQDPCPSTRGRIIAAALTTLTFEGFGRTTARAIARGGGFNQALIFYHFGSVRNLLLAALDDSSARRLIQYRESLSNVNSLQELIPLLRSLYEEDVLSGHVRVVQEVVAGASSDPELGSGIRQRLDPWLELVSEVAGRFVHGSSLEGLVSTQDLAFATTAAYLGVETVTGMSGLAGLETERRPVDSLFALAARLAPLIDSLLVTRQQTGRSTP